MPSSATLRAGMDRKVGSRGDAAAPVVVIVDDDAAVRKSLALMLRANGYRVSAYSGAVDLLHQAGPVDADILLVDYVMPGMDGLRLIARLRERGWRGSALLVTGRYDASLKDRAAAAGIDTVLEKPLEKAVLLDALKGQSRRWVGGNH